MNTCKDFLNIYFVCILFWMQLIVTQTQIVKLLKIKSFLIQVT